MSKLITICLIFCFYFQLYDSSAQQSVKYLPNPQNVKVVNTAGDTLQNPFTGGHESSQFSAIDLNMDGIQDLFVFDRAGDKITTYIGLGGDNYQYAPEYESFFPQLTNWALLADYNKDNKADIFCWFDAGIAIYKNESVPGQVKFRLMTDYLTYGKIKFGIYASRTDLPSIKDMDGDGDVDILIGDIYQTFFYCFTNESFEKFGLNYAKYDSLNYTFCDSCWGRIEGGGHDHPVNPNSTVSLPRFGIKKCNTPFNGKMSSKGNNYSILALDIDDDGDNDLLTGDAYTSRLTLLQNGRIQNGQVKTVGDSLITADTTFPSNSVRTDVPYFPAPFHVDVDHDGKRDLLITPQLQLGSANINQIFYYRNTGTDRKPVFNYRKNNFLQEKEVDLGRGVAPAFFDYDGDSIQDLIVATAGDFRQTQHKADRLILYKNYGTAARPVFKEINNDYLKISQLRKMSIVPAFGDMSGDGKPDLFLGNHDGTIMYFKNTTSTGQPATFVLEDSIFAGIDVGDFSAPAIADLDRDGKADIVIGKNSGFLSYFKNIGNANNPKFKWVTNELGNVRTSAFYYDIRYNTDGTKRDSSIVYLKVGFSSPVITDLNNDGKWDLVSGSLRGRIYMYLNIEDRLLKYWGRDRNNIYNSMAGKYEADRSFGAVTRPAFANLNGDSLPDLMIGNERGGLNLYSSSSLVPSVEDSVPDKFVDTIVTTIYTENSESYIPAFKIFPNPASDLIFIEGSGEMLEIQLFNMLGQEFYHKHYKTFSGSEQINVSGLSKGIYMMRIHNGKDQPQIMKIVIE